MKTSMVLTVLVTVLVSAVVVIFWGTEALVALQLLLIRHAHQWLTSWGGAILLTSTGYWLLRWMVWLGIVYSPPAVAFRAEKAAIQKKYDGDREAQRPELMKLHQRNFIAICSQTRTLQCVLANSWLMVANYVALLRLPELHGASFFWIPDLSARDPRFFLPLLYAALHSLQVLVAKPDQGKRPDRKKAARLTRVLRLLVVPLLPASWGLALCMGAALGLAAAVAGRLFRQSSEPLPTTRQ